MEPLFKFENNQLMVYDIEREPEIYIPFKIDLSNTDNCGSLFVRMMRYMEKYPDSTVYVPLDTFTGALLLATGNVIRSTVQNGRISMNSCSNVFKMLGFGKAKYEEKKVINPKITEQPANSSFKDFKEVDEYVQKNVVINRSAPVKKI